MKGNMGEDLRCSNCRFFHTKWKKGDAYQGHNGWGEQAPGIRAADFHNCRRHPPVSPAFEGDFGGWPSVDAGDWCGEHSGVMKQ